MQFRSANALGFSDFDDGFAPACAVADDLSRDRGDPAELMLAGAVNYIKTGSCPATPPVAGAGAGAQKATAVAVPKYKMMRSPMDEMRIMTLPGNPPR